MPTEPVLPVLGCVSRAGASTLALAIATCASPARVLECATASASGLSVAATAELGATGNGWVLGRREQVWIARAADVLLGVGDVPVPDDPPAEVGLTVLDVAWDAGLVMACASWVRDQLLAASTVIVVTAPTVPGLRRLETTLTRLAAPRVLVAVVGAPQRRWPAALTAAMGPRSRTAAAEGRLVTVPVDRQLAVRGVDSTPLPTVPAERSADPSTADRRRTHHLKG